MCPRPNCLRQTCCATSVDLPEVSELDLVRHYVRLSQLNWAIDIGFYPLGSCTMKYNPKVNEAAARLPGFARTHPYQDPHTVQGNLLLMFELQEMLKEIGGFAGVTLQPAAGAHGELTGVLIMRAYHLDRGETQRDRDHCARQRPRHQPGHDHHEPAWRWSRCPPTSGATWTWRRCRLGVRRDGLRPDADQPQHPGPL